MLFIGPTSRQLGVCAETIRRLEKAGVFVATRDRAGNRRFSTEDIDRLRGLLFRRPVGASASPLAANQCGDVASDEAAA